MTFNQRKQWQEGALGVLRKKKIPLPTSPLQAVSSFVQSSLSTSDLEQILKIHVSRARSRIEGLQHLNSLLGLVSFGSPKHQIISSLGAPFSTGAHYFEHITSCGPGKQIFIFKTEVNA